LCDSSSLVVWEGATERVQNNVGTDDRSGRNGKVLKARPVGVLQAPMTASDIKDKYHNCILKTSTRML
jgi:hypothetical protein